MGKLVVATAAAAVLATTSANANQIKTNPCAASRAQNMQIADNSTAANPCATPASIHDTPCSALDCSPCATIGCNPCASSACNPCSGINPCAAGNPCATSSCNPCASD